MSPETLDTLAALKIRAGRGDPVRRRLDSEGARISVTLPDPEYLVRSVGTGALFPGARLMRSGSALVREDRSRVEARPFAEALVSSWRDLPRRDDEGPVYRDLRTISTVSPEAALGYALQVVRRGRDLLDEAPKEERRSDRRDRTPDADRKRSSREQQRQDEESSARWWLEGYLTGWGEDNEAPAPGSRVAAPALYGMARDRLEEVVDLQEETLSPDPVVPEPRTTGDRDADLKALASYEAARRARGSYADRWEEWEEISDDEAVPLRPRVPGSLRFYGVADEVLGPRSPRSTGGLRFYTIPDTQGGTMPNTKTKDSRDAFAEAVLDRVARLAWEERGADLEAYLSGLVEARDRHEERDSSGRFEAATGTDGAVVDLEQRRRSR